MVEKVRNLILRLNPRSRRARPVLDTRRRRSRIAQELDATMSSKIHVLYCPYSCSPFNDSMVQVSCPGRGKGWILLYVICGIVGQSLHIFPDPLRCSPRLSLLGVTLLLVLYFYVTRRKGRKAGYRNLDHEGGQQTFDHEMGRTRKDPYSSDVSVLAL